MKDQGKTQEAQLRNELATMRQSLEKMQHRIAQLEMQENQCKQIVQQLYQMTEKDDLNVKKDELRSLVNQLADTSNSVIPLQPVSSQQPSTDSATTSEPFFFPKTPELQSIFEFIEANYHRPIGLKDVAREFNYSAAYLTSLVRRLTQKTLYQWIIHRRMFQARYLLQSTDLSVIKIARRIGYSDCGHFIKHFSQLHHQSPQVWRNSQHLSYLKVG